MARSRGGRDRGLRRRQQPPAPPLAAALLLGLGAALGNLAPAAPAYAVRRAAPAAVARDPAGLGHPQAPRAALQLGRSTLLRQLLPSVVAGLPALQPSAASAAGEKRAIGTNFAVEYNGPVGDDFVLGGGAGTATVPQYNARVLRVAPNGPAAAAGVRIGDEVAFVVRADGAIVQESNIRSAEKVDSFVKKYVKSGSSVTFRACGVVQPGEQAPDFKLPAADGSEVSLSDLRSGGRKVVVFFWPGRRFFGGDYDEMKFFSRVQASFNELGAAVVGITTDAPNLMKRSAGQYGVKIPLLSDPDGSVARSYGALLDLSGVKEVTDRKTFIVGTDGKVEALFPAVGWEVGQMALAAHVGSVAQALGGDAQQAVVTALPRPKSVGDIIAISQKR